MSIPHELRFLDTPATAKMLELTPRALEERRRRGDGPPYVRLSRTCVRYRLSDILEWADERTFRSTSEETGGHS